MGRWRKAWRALTGKRTRRAQSAGFGRPPSRSGGYDAAATHAGNRQHWQHATDSDAATALRDDLPTLRKRCRHEVRNNSFAAGVVDTKANDVVGTGPRLQLNPATAAGAAPPNLADELTRVEDAFAAWTGEAEITGQSFADVLSLTVRQNLESGEAFVIPTELPEAERREDAVNLRLQMIEPDRVDLPLSVMHERGKRRRDGIEFDEFGRPVNYYVLAAHPGDELAWEKIDEYSLVPADRMIHAFIRQRPGQTRGVPWITPALPQFANLRRYLLAVITAAELAAGFSATFETDATAVDNDALDELEEIPIPRWSGIMLPRGVKATQMKPEQPSGRHDSFIKATVREIGRCLNMPYNVVAGDSSGYNYASGRLDWQIYFRCIRVEQRWLEATLCRPILRRWFAEYALTRGAGGISTAAIAAIAAALRAAQWFWPGHQHVDPLKEAKAQETRIGTGTTTLSREFAAQGADWQREVEQQYAEAAFRKEMAAKYGVEINTEPSKTTETTKDDDEDEDEDQEAGKAEAA